MTKRHLVIATRESPLALRQTEWVKEQLQKHHPHLAVSFLGITTQADKMLNVSLNAIGGKGLFVKELENALLNGEADIAVHSMKDVPMELPEGLTLPVICEREDPRDAFISNQFRTFFELPRGALVGTSSLRRQSQLRAMRSDIDVQNLRGNINTRLKRLDEGDFHAIILAAAGLKRMDFTNRISHYFKVEEILPAAGQGALGIECRVDDQSVLDLIRPLNDEKAYATVTAERTLARSLEAGCMVPLAAFANLHHDQLELEGLIASIDGLRILRAKERGSKHHAESIGKRVAEVLLQQGAEKILKAYRT